MPINNDAELQNIISMANAGRNRDKIKKQLVKEFEVVDGYPVLDEFAHGNEVQKPSPYRIDFRLPLRGISPQLLSPTKLNVCNMFSTLYFMQLVVVMKSDSIKVPGKRVARSAGGVQVIESSPIMLKFIR